jgi:hypothetical protein
MATLGVELTASWLLSGPGTQPLSQEAFVMDISFGIMKQTQDHLSGLVLFNAALIFITPLHVSTRDSHIYMNNNNKGSDQQVSHQV